MLTMSESYAKQLRTLESGPVGSPIGDRMAARESRDTAPGLVVCKKGRFEEVRGERAVYWATKFDLPAGLH